MQQQTHGRFRFGSPQGLSPEARSTLANALRETPRRQAVPLEGRGGSQTVTIPATGAVFIKNYFRGGVWGRFVERGHMWNPRSRAQREFQTLIDLQAAGVSTPVPVAWAERGRAWIHCWLIMKEIPDARPFTTVIRENPPQAENLFPSIVDQVGLLLQRRCHHVDFHPGNILVGPEGKVVLIDFDKAAQRDETAQALAARYLARWERAVTKHGLPAWVSDRFQTLLLDKVRGLK